MSAPHSVPAGSPLQTSAWRLVVLHKYKLEAIVTQLCRPLHRGLQTRSVAHNRVVILELRCPRCGYRCQPATGLEVRGNSAFFPISISDGIGPCSAPDLNRTLLRYRLSAPVFGFLQGAPGLRPEFS
jgi:hypothetical protein